MLSEVLLSDLRIYLKKYKPTTFLFEGQNKEHYSAKSVQKSFNFLLPAISSLICRYKKCTFNTSN
jgi:hypothetical protein